MGNMEQLSFYRGLRSWVVRKVMERISVKHRPTAGGPRGSAPSPPHYGVLAPVEVDDIFFHNAMAEPPAVQCWDPAAKPKRLGAV